jgi:hypothetical protein
MPRFMAFAGLPKGTTFKLLKSDRTIPLQSSNLEEKKKQIHGKIFDYQTAKSGKSTGCINLRKV